MSYQVLARKWRPKSFASLVGQEHVVKALSNALAQGRLHHAYLLTGTRGVGKTTIARIMAKALNCEVGLSAEPCGVCSACTQIDGGRFVDLLEIDAASNTGIENIREVLDNAQYAPTQGRFKVYIIDEVHMLSKNAFNAMLKTLEEPPGHVKFILATTDPQKVPVTILSRCLQFSLRQMLPQQIAGHLHHVLQAENIGFDAASLTLLSQAAAGSMRDALSLLDQAIAYGAGQVEELGVRAMLGAVDRSFLFELLAHLVAQDGAGLMRVAEQTLTRGIAPDAALQDLSAVLHQVALLQAVPSGIPDDTPHYADLVKLSKAWSPEDVQLYYQITLHGRRDLPLAPDEFAGFSMTLLRMLAFAPLGPQSAASLVPPAIVDAPAPTPAIAAPPITPVTPIARAEVPSNVIPLRALVPQPVLADTPADPAMIEFDGDWPSLVAQLPGGQAKMLASHAALLNTDAGVFNLVVADANKAMAGRDYQEKLRQALKQVLGCDVVIKVSISSEDHTTPAKQEQRLRAEQQAVAEAAINADPMVRTLMQDFGATILPGSIQPRRDVG